MLTSWAVVGAAGGRWGISKGGIMYNNASYHVRGINWFGFDSDCRVVHGLWMRPVDEYFELLRSRGFNSLRIPFAWETIERWDDPPLPDCVNANDWMLGVSSRSLMHMIFQKAALNNMSVVLDFHRIHGIIQPGLTTYDMSQNDVFLMWDMIIDEFSMHPNLMGIDLKNEPHLPIGWSTWGSQIRAFIRRMKTNHPTFDGLLFIEGIEDPADGSVWGGSFRSMPRDVQSAIAACDRCVLSPHIYGHSIRDEDAFSDTWDTYDAWFGLDHRPFLSNPVVIGEIGGWVSADEAAWLDNLINYMKSRRIRDVYYWCLNADSGDTGGLLRHDWSTINEDWVSYMERIQPRPTLIDFT